MWQNSKKKSTNLFIYHFSLKSNLKAQRNIELQDRILLNVRYKK